VVMADVASALTRLDEAERTQVGMLFVTTDPARDDEATLRAYLDRFDPSFEGLTGPLTRIVRAGKSLGVAIEKGEKLPSGGYEVSHGTQVVGMLPDGTAPVVWTQGTAPEQIAEDIHVVLGEGGVPTGETQ
jgi:protein SCO1/2